MDLPIRFPTDAEVIAEEVARFRALTPAQRVESIRGLLAGGQRLMRLSPKAAYLREYTAHQEALGRRAVLEFMAAHAD